MKVFLMVMTVGELFDILLEGLSETMCLCLLDSEKDYMLDQKLK
jgi:hypothetical protein